MFLLFVVRYERS